MFSFCNVYSSFFKSVISLKLASYEEIDFVKFQTLESNEVNVTLNDVILLPTRWKLNKLDMNCKLWKYLLSSCNCIKVTGEGSRTPPPQSEGHQKGPV